MRALCRFPRSIIGWFGLCWGLFLIAALVVGAILVALYQETSSQRTERAVATLARACDAIINERVVAPNDVQQQVIVAAVSSALRDFPGVEGGIWGRDRGSLAYAFPSYEGSGTKTDLPQAEEPTIRNVAETAIEAKRPISWRRNSSSQVLLLQGCPFPDGSEDAAWTMARVVTVGGRPFLYAATGLAFLLIVLLGSAGLLAFVLWKWSERLRSVERALAVEDESLPFLALTGQRDLDRIVAAINGAGAKATEARRRSDEYRQRLVEGERLAALGRVAAGVAHEVRNPMSAMRLKAENALATDADPQRAKDALRVVVDQVARMDELLQNLLRSVERSPIRREPIDSPRRLLMQHASLFAEQGGKRRITVVAPAQVEPPPQLDPAQIGRALDNLILNAIQNSDDGSLIELSADIDTKAFKLSVSDQGFGVPPNIREHLFEPFASGRANGTGLGLAIVREIAEAHGGRIMVEHRSNGTTFTLEIPLRSEL